MSAGAGAWLTDARLVIAMALHELRRRKSLAVISVLTLVILGLYGWGTSEILGDLTSGPAAEALPAEETARGAGFIMLGIAVFLTFSLASVLAIFTTMSAIRGDAEQGLLQPVLVRPVARSAVVIGRIAAATLVGLVYVAVVVGIASLLTELAGGEAPGNLPAVIGALAGAVAVIAALTVLFSTFFGSSASGMAAMMLVSGGFFASLVRQIGEATGSEGVERWAGLVTDVLGFNALYEGSLGALTDGVRGIAGLAIELGPFGAQRSLDTGLVLLTLLELVVLAALATWRLRRIDL